MSQISPHGDADIGTGRGKQPRVTVEIQVAEAQRAAARATARSARYMLWAAIFAAISTVVSTAGAVYVVSALAQARPDAPRQP